MTRFLIALAAAVALCCGTVFAADIDAAVLEEGSNLDSYRATALDACQMIESFGKGDADVQDIYTIGRNAQRPDGRFRIPKVVMERPYTGELFYELGKTYHSDPQFYGTFMGAVVNGAAPYDGQQNLDARKAAGKSWARMYQIVYMFHEFDVAVKNAKEGKFPAAVEEIEDSWALFTGPADGTCSLRKLFEGRDAGLTRALKAAYDRALQAAIDEKSSELEQIQTEVHKLIIAMHLKLTVDTATKRTTPTTKAAAEPIFKTIEQFVGNNAGADTDYLLELFDFTCKSSACAAVSPQANLAPKIKQTVAAIASKNAIAAY